jgi:isopentenyl diphosphate isomerase/L-lactate dehydrogenase-like FMN-dependent dehydrogenase
MAKKDELPQAMVDRMAREENEADRELIMKPLRAAKKAVKENLEKGEKEHQAPKPRMNLGKLPGKAADKKLDLDGYNDMEKNNAAVFLRKGFSDEDAKDMAKQKAYKSGGSVRSSASKRADGCAIRGKTRA